MELSISELYDLFKKSYIVNTDSRQIEKGGIFFALSGEHFNGHDFVEQSFEKGAAYCIVSEKKYEHINNCIYVDNTLETLQNLSTFHRQQFEIPVLAITGSNGKTTSKELIREVLKSTFKVHATIGNLNNHLGVPLTLLKMPLDTEFAIIEMGANHLGEISLLCNIARPNYGFITNIGKAHLEGFGGIEGVKKGKLELLDYINETGGIFFQNNADEHLKSIMDSDKIVPVQQLIISSTNNLFLEVIDPDSNQKIKTHLFGTFNSRNVSAAVAMGKYFNISFEKIRKGIEEYLPTMNRSQTIKLNGADIVLDAYNANPSSMKASIASFDISFSKKIYILGGMLELGEDSKKEHSSLLDSMMQKDWEICLLVGKEFEFAKSKNEFEWFENAIQAGEWLKEIKISGKAILLKGSRSIGLERIVKILEDS